MRLHGGEKCAELCGGEAADCGKGPAVAVQENGATIEELVVRDGRGAQ